MNVKKLLLLLALFFVGNADAADCSSPISSSVSITSCEISSSGFVINSSGTISVSGLNFISDGLNSGSFINNGTVNLSRNYSIVTAPLAYAKLSDRSTTALMGVKVNHALTPKTNLTASLGVEQDLDHKSDQLVATGVSGLTSENFNNNIRHTRPVVSLGAYYAVAKNQRLSGDIYYQQLPFQSTDSATAYVNYTIGF